jgi:ParB-like chromosome segregation protein Spo0J
VSALPPIPVLGAGGQLRAIPVAAIRVAPRNPRTDAEATLGGLTASLGAGLVQLPIVVPVSGDTYELVDGERRWRSAQAAGHATLTCLVREPGTPSATLFTQILANLHRQELGPLDESAALKAAWLVLNAQALGLSTQADALLGSAAHLRDVLVPLRALLTDNGWNWREPPVSQAVFVAHLGLGMSAAALKKKLQVLGASEAVQATARQHALTAAAIRALMTLEPEQQTTLLAAVDAAPPLARQVRAIVQGVTQKGRTLAEAISVVTDGPTPAEVAPPPTRADASGAAPADGPPPPLARPGIPDDAAMDAVLPIMELAQDLDAKLTQLQRLLGGRPALDALPDPWGGYLADAMRQIGTAMHPYSAEGVTDVM